MHLLSWEIVRVVILLRLYVSLARDLEGPRISKQVLIYPSTDARLDHPSINTFGTGYMLSKPLIEWFLDNYKQTDADIHNPLMSPLLTKDVSNLPPAFICTAAFDPLKDEGEAYAKKLKAAGNQVVFKEYPHVIHGFFNMPKISKEALDAHQDIRDFLAGSEQKRAPNALRKKIHLK